MESNSTSYSSSNKSISLAQNTEKTKVQKHASYFQSHNSLLHSLRKTKSRKKAPVAPIPQAPTKVYKVDPFNFKELVHQLTGAPEFKSRQLFRHNQNVQSVKGDDVTTLDVASHNPIVEISSRNITATSPPMHKSWYMDLQSELCGVETKESGTEGATNPGFLDMNLSSPSSYSNWCNFFPLLSPRT
ncbi:hypothetical protein TanjilG_22233 [Lupinus angustifolius]|uniref:VQ domain-containing protein n=1 Tax=Lupinus angustifolius TaxID=3871 RepID=A0A1J7G4Z6_LUPAN|nr:PREDICTED: uncharacterized protein LOC109341287 [Lupinus angustifolius]OIV89401.1 hypothetical protein TanjilG_22233 [Lupinus angustifolius]